MDGTMPSTSDQNHNADAMQAEQAKMFEYIRSNLDEIVQFAEMIVKMPEGSAKNNDIIKEEPQQ